MPKIEFWCDLASPYSHLSAMRIDTLAAARDIAVDWHPFLLGPIFAEQGFKTSPFNLYPAKGAYLWRDLERLSARERAGFRRPEPFPQNSILAARVALALDAADRGRFIQGVFRVQFCDGQKIDDKAALGVLLDALSLPRTALEAAQSDAVKARLRAETDEAKARGIFGAPFFVTSDRELFWGNDRLVEALDWAIGRY